jgi:dienelactone hydrolase
MSRETFGSDDGGAWRGAVRGAVIVAHGGTEVSSEPVTPFDLAVLRMVPFELAIRHGLRGAAVAVSRPRYRVRGWNGEQASPVADLRAVIDELVTRFGPIPVVLIGHSMGARASFRVAGHPAVTAVAGLAPWLPPTEPVDQLAGRRVLLAHGTADTVTRPAETWAYAERARAITTAATIEVLGGEHTMLRRAPLWHRLAVDFSRLSLDLPVGPGEVTAAFGQPAERRHLVLRRGAERHPDRDRVGEPAGAARMLRRTARRLQVPHRRAEPVEGVVDREPVAVPDDVRQRARVAAVDELPASAHGQALGAAKSPVEVGRLVREQHRRQFPG